jgi:hypothetical protein
MSDEEPKARAALDALADRGLLAAIERRAKRIDPKLREMPSLPPVKTHLDPADWRAGYLVEPRDYDLPLQLFDDLKELTPQSLLRDLYRPVYEHQWFEMEFHAQLDPGGREAWREARRAQRRDPRTQVEPTARAVREEMHRRRAFLREQWKPKYADDQQRPSINVAHDPSLA